MSAFKRQALRKPGARLMRGVSPSFVRSRVARRPPRGLNHELPMVPCVDFLLCLVLFLLGMFSASAETCIKTHVDVPQASHTVPTIEAPVLSVTRNVILVDGLSVSTVRELEADGKLRKLEQLYDVLKAKRELRTQLAPNDKSPHSLIIRADKTTPILVVKCAFLTATEAGYSNISFMVERRS